MMRHNRPLEIFVRPLDNDTAESGFPAFGAGQFDDLVIGEVCGMVVGIGTRKYR